MTPYGVYVSYQRRIKQRISWQRFVAHQRKRMAACHWCGGRQQRRATTCVNVYISGMAKAQQRRGGANNGMKSSGVAYQRSASWQTAAHVERRGVKRGLLARMFSRSMSCVS